VKQSGSEWLHLAAIAAVLLLVLTNIARADGGLRLEGGWVRALPLALPSAGYFTLRNGTRADAVLVKAQSPACGVLSLHKSEFTGGICRMRDLPEVNVPALGAVAFTPQSYHLMCEQARPMLKPGAKIPVTLIFKDGARIPALFTVRGAAER
jgi:copper(I)-binding protein